MCTIGVSTLDPDGLEPGNDLNSLEHLEDLDYPDEDTDPDPDGQDELWPAAGPPVAYQGATGEVLHSKWVTFHEGPALLM
jgi:hypothetical protein